MSRSRLVSRRTAASLIVTLALGASCKGEDGRAGEAGTDTDPSAGTGEAGGDAGQEEGGTGSAGEDDGDDGADDGVPDEPHARGTIVLGESHPPQSSNSSPIVTASFVPDFLAQPDTCGTTVAGCFVQTPPDCEGLCELDEYCTFDAGCQSTCQRVCDLGCGSDEVCYFPIPDNPACKKIEYFDAGALNFTGTTVPVTLFPPYLFQGDVTGALYLPQSEITVHASGTNGAGFEGFEESFMSTTYIDTTIEDIGLEDMYGAGPLPVEWAAGSDDVRVTVTVTGLAAGYGMITCDADDSAGSFGVPREAIEAALPDEEIAGLSLSVERRKTDVRKGFSTTGELLEHTVQPEGWLELVSTSVEAITLTGCGGGLAYCDGECIDVQWDQDNCGGCGDPCSAIEICEYGECISNCGWDQVACGNECVDTSSDPDHCGGCNLDCDPGQTCSFGDCVGGDSGGDTGGDTGGDAGDCCVAHAGVGCSNNTIEACVCRSDAYCCDTAWDGTCAGEVESFGCGVC